MTTIKRLLIATVVIVLCVIVAAQEKRDTFSTICDNHPAPAIEMQLSGGYLVYTTQFVDYNGDLVYVIFNNAMSETNRAIFEGEWCDAPR